MPIYFNYEKEKGALYGSIEGEFSVKEVDLAIKEITESKKFPPDIRALWDMRGLDFETTDITVLMDAASARNRNPQRANSKLAFIVDPGLGYWRMRMYEALTDDLRFRVRVFLDYAEGESWLLSDE